MAISKKSWCLIFIFGLLFASVVLLSQSFSVKYPVYQSDFEYFQKNIKINNKNENKTTHIISNETTQLEEKLQITNSTVLNESHAELNEFQEEKFPLNFPKKWKTHLNTNGQGMISLA